MAWRRGQAYSQDLRDRVLASEGLTLQQAAERFSVSRSYVSKIRSWLRQSGSAAPRPQKSPVATRLVGLHADIVAHVHAHADLTLAELRAWLADEKEVSASLGLIWDTLAGLGLTHKKSRSGRRSRPVPTLPLPARPGASGSP